MQGGCKWKTQVVLNKGGAAENTAKVRLWPHVLPVTGTTISSLLLDHSLSPLFSLVSPSVCLSFCPQFAGGRRRLDFNGNTKKNSFLTIWKNHSQRLTSTHKDTIIFTACIGRLVDKLTNRQAARIQQKQKVALKHGSAWCHDSERDHV